MEMSAAGLVRDRASLSLAARTAVRCQPLRRSIEFPRTCPESSQDHLSQETFLHRKASQRRGFKSRDP